MIIKIQDQDLLLLVAHVYPNYPGVFPPPPPPRSFLCTKLFWIGEKEQSRIKILTSSFFIIYALD